MSKQNSWVEQMGQQTQEHRRQRARAFADRGQARYRELREQGFSESYARHKSKWFRDRAEGQRKRVERVLDCGASIVLVQCVDCGLVHERRDGCRINLLCVPCRKEIISVKRAAFQRSREVVLDEATARGLLNPRRRGGAWREKLLTLTAAHIGALGYREPIRRFRDAMPRFLRRMGRHMDDRDARSWEFYRVFEWTTGSDGLGHPHFHLWLFCPFVDRDLLIDWWRRSLLEEGYQPDELANLIVDIRSTTNGTDAAQELIKYLTKDLDVSGGKLPPEVFAEVYKELDGGRTTQASRRFIQRGSRKAVCACGSSKWTRTTATRKPEVEKPPV